MGSDDEITLKVFRFDPSCDEWPHYDIYHVPWGNPQDDEHDYRH